MARHFPDRREAAYYWCLALISLPAGLAIGLRPVLEASTIAGLMVLIAAGYWGLSYYLRAYLSEPWRITLATVGGLLPILGAYLAQAEVLAVALCLVAAALMGAELALRFAKAWFALVALFAILLVPVTVGQGVADPALTADAQAWSYAALAGFLVLWRRQLGTLGESFEAVGISGYLLAILAALAFALVSQPATAVELGLVLAVSLYAVSRREPLPEAFVYLAAAIAASALIQVADVFEWPVSLNGLFLATFGALLYLVGRRSDEPARAGALRYSGIIITFIGLYPGLLTPTPPLEAVVALATAGLLLWYDARWHGWGTVQELAGAVLVLALDWSLRYAQVIQLEWYTVPAAAYFAYLAYRRHKLEHDAYDIFTAGALAFLTVPLLIQIFTHQGAVYSVVLVLEAITLIIMGSAIGYRLLNTWGLISLGIVLLYYVPYMLNVIPQILSTVGQ
jgi:hypothetical protein